MPGDGLQGSRQPPDQRRLVGRGNGPQLGRRHDAQADSMVHGRGREPLATLQIRGRGGASAGISPLAERGNGNDHEGDRNLGPGRLGE